MSLYRLLEFYSCSSNMQYTTESDSCNGKRLTEVCNFDGMLLKKRVINSLAVVTSLTRYLLKRNAVEIVDTFDNVVFSMCRVHSLVCC